MFRHTVVVCRGVVLLRSCCTGLGVKVRRSIVCVGFKSIHYTVAFAACLLPARILFHMAHACGTCLIVPSASTSTELKVQVHLSVVLLYDI